MRIIKGYFFNNCGINEVNVDFILNCKQIFILQKKSVCYSLLDWVLLFIFVQKILYFVVTLYYSDLNSIIVLLFCLQLCWRHTTVFRSVMWCYQVTRCVIQRSQRSFWCLTSVVSGSRWEVKGQAMTYLSSRHI